LLAPYDISKLTLQAKKEAALQRLHDEFGLEATNHDNQDDPERRNDENIEDDNISQTTNTTLHNDAPTSDSDSESTVVLMERLRRVKEARATSNRRQTPSEKRGRAISFSFIETPAPSASTTPSASNTTADAMNATSNPTNETTTTTIEEATPTPTVVETQPVRRSARGRKPKNKESM
jgi:CCR4-NOT transcriptional regulation complex NOT5 subunit